MPIIKVSELDIDLIHKRLMAKGKRNKEKEYLKMIKRINKLINNTWDGSYTIQVIEFDNLSRIKKELKEAGYKNIEYSSETNTLYFKRS